MKKIAMILFAITNCAFAQTVHQQGAVLKNSIDTGLTNKNALNKVKAVTEGALMKSVADFATTIFDSCKAISNGKLSSTALDSILTFSDSGDVFITPTQLSTKVDKSISIIVGRDQHFLTEGSTITYPSVVEAVLPGRGILVQTLLSTQRKITFDSAIIPKKSDSLLYLQTRYRSDSTYNITKHYNDSVAADVYLNIQAINAMAFNLMPDIQEFSGMGGSQRITISKAVTIIVAYQMTSNPSWINVTPGNNVGDLLYFTLKGNCCQNVTLHYDNTDIAPWNGQFQYPSTFTTQSITQGKRASTVWMWDSEKWNLVSHSENNQ